MHYHSRQCVHFQHTIEFKSCYASTEQMHPIETEFPSRLSYFNHNLYLMYFHQLHQRSSSWPRTSVPLYSESSSLASDKHPVIFIHLFHHLMISHPLIAFMFLYTRNICTTVTVAMWPYRTPERDTLAHNTSHQHTTLIKKNTAKKQQIYYRNNNNIMHKTFLLHLRGLFKFASFY